MVNDLLIGLLVAVAYVGPSVVFARAIKPAAEAVQSVGRSATEL
jgi:hypothetical protein